MSNIGTLNEKPLHASLKEWYAQPGDQFEVPLDGFVIDIVRDNLLLEIQTGNFAPLKSKLHKLVQNHQVRLIYPIAQEKWLVKLPENEDGKVVRRKSPKRGRLEGLFNQMVSFPKLLSHDNFSVEVLLIQEEEVRLRDGKRRWRRRGWCTEERRLLAVVQQRVFEKPTDWLELLPAPIMDEPFTTKDLAEATGIKVALAQKMAYCLRETQVIRLIGKRGRSNLYEVERS